MLKKGLQQSGIILVLYGISALFFYYFIRSGAPATMRGTDATGQFLYFKHLIRQLVEDGGLFWSWVYGLGGDVYGQFGYYYTTSISFIASLLFDTPTVDAILALTLPTLMLQVTFGMYIMFTLLRYKERSYLAAFLGSVLYGGSAFLANYAVIFDFMMESFMLLPLVILGFEHYIKSNKPYAFVITLAIVLFSNFYFAYMTTIFLMIYAIYKFFDEPRFTKSVKGFLQYVLTTSGYYMLSVMIAAVGFFPTVYQFLQSGRIGAEYELSLFFKDDTYARIPRWFFLSYQETGVIGIAMIAGVLLLAMFGLPNRQYLPKKLWLVTLLLLLVSPYVYSMMNGFSAMQRRWFYMLLFGFTYLAAYSFDDVIKMKRRTIVWLSVILLSIVYWSGQRTWSLQGRETEATDSMLIGFAIITVILLLLAMTQKVWLYRGATISIILIVIMTGIVQYHATFTALLGPQQDQKKAAEAFFTKPGFTNEPALDIVSQINQRRTGMERTIWDDPSTEVNMSMYYGYPSSAAYNSLIPNNVHHFFKEQSKTLQPGTVSVYNNYDERLFLETLLGNRFTVVQPNARHKPYGYEQVYANKEWELWENQYALPLGVWFPNTAYVTESQVAPLTSAQQDELLLQSFIVKDADKSLQQQRSHMDLQDLQATTLKQGLAGVTVVNGTQQGNTFVMHNNGSIRIPFQKPKEQQGEVHVALTINKRDDSGFTMQMLDKKMTYLGKYNVWNYPKEQFHFNLGWQHKTDYIDVQLTEGTYTITDVRIDFLNYSHYVTQVEQLKKYPLTQITTTPHTLSGVIEAPAKGVVLLSIPYSKGWVATIDGQEVPLHEVDFTFMGLPITAGKHTITLAYQTPYFIESLGITVIGLLLLLLHYVLPLYRRKMQRVKGGE